MSKTPENVCGCYSEPVAGKTNVFTTCGRLTTSRFAPGHDAKLKGGLIRAAVEGRTFDTADDKGKITRNDPAALAESLGWSKYITRALEVVAEKAAKAQAKAAETDGDRAAKAKAKEEAAAAKAAERATTKAAKDAAKAAAAEAKAAAKADKPAQAPASKPVQYVKVKVGRWAYDDGVIVGREGDKLIVQYTKGGKSETATVPEGAVSHLDA